MQHETTGDTLSNKDHQKALAVINWLNNCRNQNEFNQVLKEALLPLINCNGIFYARYEQTQDKLQLLDTINPSSCNPYNWKQLIHNTLHKPAVTQTATLAPYTILTTTHLSQDSYNELSSRLHDVFSQSWDSTHRYHAILPLSIDHQQTYLFYFCRLNTTQHTYNPRDIMLLEMLRPTLLQTIKLILFQEDSRNSSHIMAFWSEYTEPVAVIRNNGEMLFQSPAFEHMIQQEKNVLMSTVSILVKTIQHKKLEWHSHLSKLGKRLYEIKLTLLNSNANHQHTYLLHLTRITHTIGKIFNQLSRKGLTQRELEIALLIYQGTPTRQIADKIHLSYHTVRNHIKNIYSKLGVSSRGEMLMGAEQF